MIKVGILGYGGIARSHRNAYEMLAEKGAPVELVALCDINPAQFTNLVTINQGGADTGIRKEYHTYTSLDDMLANEQLDTVDICLPTFLHCEYAVKLLKLGYNVQCEKPMGLDEAECKQILAAEQESGKKLMIGMCLRFDGAYTALKAIIDDGRYGKVNSAHFDRLGSLPGWGSFEGWYRDPARSGGVAMDLHIHDVDMIRFLFGEPKAVSSIATNCKVHSTTIASHFYYDDVLVSAIADWGRAATAQFEARYRVNFDHATVVCEHGVITVYPEEGEPFPLDFDNYEHMATEIEYFARVTLGELENTVNTPASAAATVRLVRKTMESADLGGQILPF